MDDLPVINYGSTAYVYVQVADHVQRQIETGRLRPGARLPNERAMAEQYKVAPMTVRRALRELRERGLVVTVKDKGSFVVR